MIQEHESETSVAPASEGPPLARRFGRYTLLEKIATGGMAEIWLASQKGLADFVRFVVIKKILSHLGEQESFVRMFLDEARMCSQLNHPNIVQIYDLGKEGGAYFIAMEYIAGENLAAVSWRGVKRNKPVSQEFAAKIICDACKALHYAHHMRGNNGQPLEIVHRDVSPQNILVTYEGEVKVVDFGIAKAASKSEHTKTGMLKGKFSYMSPEQCLGERLDGRSDIFALGIVLYELCTGKRLFKHESELMILEMITRRPIVPPSRVLPGMSPKLEAIILKSLEKTADARFQTAQDMQIALEEYLREAGAPSSSAELSRYMSALFGDKIEEKRKLREAATRGELEFAPGEGEGSASESEEKTDQKHPPRPGSGAGRALKAAAIVPADIAPAPAPAPTPSAIALGKRPSNPSHPSISAPSYGALSVASAPPSKNWVARLLIAFAIMTIGVAVYIMLPPEIPVTQVQLKKGSVSISTKPAGAKLSIDGKPLLDAAGSPLVTPLKLSQLDYGVTYRLRFELAHHRAIDKPLLMGGDAEGQTLEVELEPIPATLIASVVGVDDPAAVEVFYGTEKVGTGPTARKELSPGVVNITASAVGRTCTASPPAVDLSPAATLAVEIYCKKNPVTQVAAPSPRPAAVVSAGGDSCKPSADGAIGYATINVRPYADVYLDGKKIGETPIAKYKHTAGCAMMRLVNAQLGKEKTVRIEIAPNIVSIFEVDLGD